MTRWAESGKRTEVLRLRHWSQTTAFDLPSGTGLRFLFRRAAVASAVERLGLPDSPDGPAPDADCESSADLGLASDDAAGVDCASGVVRAPDAVA